MLNLKEVLHAPFGGKDGGGKWDGKDKECEEPQNGMGWDKHARKDDYDKGKDYDGRGKDHDYGDKHARKDDYDGKGKDHDYDGKHARKDDYDGKGKDHDYKDKRCEDPCERETRKEECDESEECDLHAVLASLPVPCLIDCALDRLDCQPTCEAPSYDCNDSGCDTPV